MKIKSKPRRITPPQPKKEEITIKERIIKEPLFYPIIEDGKIIYVEI
jgi:hypothetical protein